MTRWSNSMHRITELKLLKPSCRARAVLMALAIAIPALSVSPSRAEEAKSFCDSYSLQGLEEALGPQWEEFLAVLANTGEEAKEALGKTGTLLGKAGGVAGVARINADAV